MSVGGHCRGGRPPRAPALSTTSPSSFISIVSRSIIRRSVGRGRRAAVSFWADEADGPEAPESLEMLSRRAAAVRSDSDGSDAVATALMQHRRRWYGGTPSRPDQNGVLHVRLRPALTRELAASLAALQAVARADVTRAVGVKAEAAVAAATRSASSSRADVEAAMAADERAFLAFRAAEADAAKAVEAAAAACSAAAAASVAAGAAAAAADATAAAAAAVDEFSTTSTGVYFSPVSDFE